MTVMKINGVDYESHATFEAEITSDGTLIYPLYPSGHRIMMPENRCECCGRGDWRELVYESWEKAIEAGWLTPVSSDA